MLSRSQAKAATRQALLDAARLVIARRGFGNSRLDEIASEAGVTTGAVYANFKGKDALFIALVERETGRFLERMAAAIGAGIDVADRSRRAILALLDTVDSEPELYSLQMELWQRALHEPRFREIYLANRAVITGAVAMALEEGAAMSGRELAMPAHDLAALVEAVGDGIAIRRLIEPGAISAESAAQFAARIGEALTVPRTTTGSAPN